MHSPTLFNGRHYSHGQHTPTLTPTSPPQPKHGSLYKFIIHTVGTKIFEWGHQTDKLTFCCGLAFGHFIGFFCEFASYLTKLHPICFHVWFLWFIYLPLIVASSFVNVYSTGFTGYNQQYIGYGILFGIVLSHYYVLILT